MLEKYPNSKEAHHFLEQFKDVYQFKDFNVENGFDMNDDIGCTDYKATTTDDNWNFLISFRSNTKEKTAKKQYKADVSFTNKAFNTVRNYALYNFAESMSEVIQKKYNLDFSLPMTVIKWFVEQGIESCLIIKNEELCYTPQMTSHLTIDSHRRGTLSFIEKKVMMIIHNKVLQQGQGYKNSYYKKSLLKMEIVYLVHSDEKLHPYFKITLPYNADKKLTCLMSFENKNELYLFEKDALWKNKHIDTLSAISNDEKDFKDYLKVCFQNEMRISIAKKLNLDKKEADGLSMDELKQYYTLIDMVQY